MKFGLIGLSRIGGGLARQAIEKGHQVVGYVGLPPRSPWAVSHLESWLGDPRLAC